MKKISKITSMFLLVMMLSMMGMSFAYAADAPSKDALTGTLKFDSQKGLQLEGLTDTTNGNDAWTNFLTKYKNFIVGISGIGAISMLAFFIFQFMKLGANGSSNKRSDILVGLLWTGVAAAGLGAVSIIVGFFYNAAK